MGHFHVLISWIRQHNNRYWHSPGCSGLQDFMDVIMRDIPWKATSDWTMAVLCYCPNKDLLEWMGAAAEPTAPLLPTDCPPPTPHWLPPPLLPTDCPPLLPTDCPPKRPQAGTTKSLRYICCCPLPNDCTWFCNFPPAHTPDFMTMADRGRPKWSIRNPACCLMTSIVLYGGSGTQRSYNVNCLGLPHKSHPAS